MASYLESEPPSPGESSGDESQGVEATRICEKMKLNQRLAAKELVNTEAKYVHNLQLCASDIRSHLHELPQGDLDVIFSNIDDIIKVNSRFLKDLEKAGSEEEQISLLGNLFLEFQEEMENTYKVYCACYNQALALVETYRKVPKLQKVIHDVITALVPQACASGLSFLLVMPVQRVTRYPLLLQKILENTPPDDEAYEALQRATRAMQEVNSNINEYKRQKEIATKYNKLEHLTVRERLARINTHSISKKTLRLSQLFKQEAGIVTRTEDREFDDLEEKFHWVALCVNELKSNVAAYLDHLETFLRIKPYECDLEMEGGAVQQYCCFTRDLHLLVFLEFKQRLERLVYHPLHHLSKALLGPQNLIKKRLDKLLDFERTEEKLAEMGSMTYEEEAIRHTYQALNSLLVSELPQFNQVAIQWLGQILNTLMALQRDLAQQVLQRAERELGQLPHSHVSDFDFRKLIEDTLDKTSAQLQSFCQNFQKVLPVPVRQPLQPAAERQVQALMSKYSPSKLYQVTSNISGSGNLALTLQKGQIVAVLQDRDIKGNTSRWLVDTGGYRGYVPAGKLEPYQVVPHDKPSMQSGSGDGFKFLPVETPRSSTHVAMPVFQVVAAYPFVARSNYEVSLQAGQSVTVLERQDKKGNPEWSLVEVNGQRGYVPSNFLVCVPSPTPWGWSLPTGDSSLSHM
ncbi:rho guanine nucleotide exchange factor 37 isoform X1 [Monodelphis domestica]|uniref:Rho guanine nucleotide exchange factor 37 n=1 Tax=Monodelphis domestica TaxID=13616 RepID=F6VCA2_MONDO|nr:rho guanine nucleotide exchange factor 37 isoform X1 [Monodelphis domestica]